MVRDTVTLEDVTCIIPARNEAHTIGDVVQRALSTGVALVIVVDDASTDETGALASQAGATVIRQPYRKGNGAAVKAGVRAARTTVVALLDGDGQHDPNAIPDFVDALNEGYDLVVGARRPSNHANVSRGLGNRLYNRLASWMVGQEVADLTSGFRVTRRANFSSFLHMLPNGFSYPTTSTMAFYRAGFSVRFKPIEVGQRDGRSQSHIRFMRDGARFLLIIFRITTLYSPLKLFFPTALMFLISGIGYYSYTFVTKGNFTNFGALLMTTSVLVFLIGLVSEQITMLVYGEERDSAEKDE